MKFDWGEADPCRAAHIRRKDPVPCDFNFCAVRELFSIRKWLSVVFAQMRQNKSRSASAGFGDPKCCPRMALHSCAKLPQTSSSMVTTIMEIEPIQSCAPVVWRCALLSRPAYFERFFTESPKLAKILHRLAPPGLFWPRPPVIISRQALSNQFDADNS